MNISDVKVIDRCDDIDFDEVNSILHFYGLSDLDTPTQRQVFLNSYVTIFIKEGDKIVGLGRSISDGITHASIYNIAVRDEYRGHGIGKLIIDEILKRVEGCTVDEILKRVEGCTVTLYTSPRHIGLYEHWGFRRMKTSYAIFHNEEYYEEQGFIE